MNYVEMNFKFSVFARTKKGNTQILILCENFGNLNVHELRKEETFVVVKSCHSYLDVLCSARKFFE